MLILLNASEISVQRSMCVCACVCVCVCACYCCVLYIFVCASMMYVVCLLCFLSTYSILPGFLAFLAPKCYFWKQIPKDFKNRISTVSYLFSINLLFSFVKILQCIPFTKKLKKKKSYVTLNKWLLTYNIIIHCL